MGKSIPLITVGCWSMCGHIHHHHVVLPVWISLTLSHHFSLSFIASGRSSGLHTVSSHSCCMYVRAGHPAFAWPYVGVHRSTSLMSSFLLLQQCPASINLVGLQRLYFIQSWPTWLRCSSAVTWISLSASWWHLVKAVWHRFLVASIHITRTKPQGAVPAGSDSIWKG